MQLWLPIDTVYFSKPLCIRHHTHVSGNERYALLPHRDTKKVPFNPIPPLRAVTISVVKGS